MGDQETSLAETSTAYHIQVGHFRKQRDMHNDIQDVSEADLQNTAQDEHEYKICKRNFVFIARLNHLIDFPTLSLLLPI